MNNLKVNLEKDKENKKIIKLNLELAYHLKCLRDENFILYNPN